MAREPRQLAPALRAPVDDGDARPRRPGRARRRSPAPHPPRPAARLGARPVRAGGRARPRKPAPSVFSPTSSSPLRTTQLTAPIRAPACERRSRWSTTATLCGIVQLKPREAHRPRPPDGVAQAVRVDLDREVAPVEPGRGERGLDHRLRRVLVDGLAEEADELLPKPRHQRPPGRGPVDARALSSGSTTTRRGGALVSLEAREQEAHRFLSHRAGRLADGRQRRRGERRVGDVVVSGHAELVRDGEARRAAAASTPIASRSFAATTPSGAAARSSLGLGVSALQRERSARPRRELEAVTGEGGFHPARAPGRSRALVAVHEGEAPVAEPDEVVDDEPHPASLSPTTHSTSGGTRRSTKTVGTSAASARTSSRGRHRR